MSNSRSTRRFRVALSFSGEERDLVRRVADRLAKHYGSERIFYDEYYRGELARLDLDNYLQDIYNKESDLIVLFFSRSYHKKKWCGLEWRAIRDLISKRPTHIIPVRMASAPYPKGLFPVDGYLAADQLTAEEIASNICDRYIQEFTKGPVRRSLRGSGAMIQHREPDTSAHPGGSPDLETYVYVSTAKIEMLISQIARSQIRKLCDELEIESSLVKELAGPLTHRTRYLALRIIERYLAFTRRIGEIDNPLEYVRGEISMQWGPYGFRSSHDSPLVYFGAETEKTILGLGGSSHHIIGATGLAHAHSHSATPFIVSRLMKELGMPSDEESDWMVRAAGRDRHGRDLIPVGVDLATRQMEGPSERLRFLARTLAFYRAGEHDGWSQDKNILLGTPLFVCLSTPIQSAPVSIQG